MQIGHDFAVELFEKMASESATMRGALLSRNVDDYLKRLGSSSPKGEGELTWERKLRASEFVLDFGRALHPQSRLKETREEVGGEGEGA